MPTAGDRQETLDLLTDTEERLEVAQVQVETQRALSSLTNVDDDVKEDALQRLNTTMYNISSVSLPDPL